MAHLPGPKRRPDSHLSTQNITKKISIIHENYQTHENFKFYITRSISEIHQIFLSSVLITKKFSTNFKLNIWNLEHNFLLAKCQCLSKLENTKLGSCNGPVMMFGKHTHWYYAEITGWDSSNI